MRSLNIFFAIVAGFLFFSCDKEEISGNFDFGVEKSFKIDETYQSKGHSLKFMLTEINDSRCPMDVDCNWAGMVQVKITIDKPVSGTIILNSYNNPTDTLANYSFELMNVLPYPISTQTTELEDYDVKLKVKKIES